MTPAAKPLIVWGAAGHAKVLADFVGQAGYKIVALFDNDPNVRAPLAGIELYHGRAGFERWRAGWQGDAHFAVAVGGSRGEERLELMTMLEQAHLHAATLVHPRALVAGSASLAKGSQVLALATICGQASIGKGCIINTGAIVDHDSVLAEGVHVAPGAVLCDSVRAERCAFIGVGATVMAGVVLGEGAIVGAGACVLDDVPAQTTVVGVPAKPLTLKEVQPSA